MGGLMCYSKNMSDKERWKLVEGLQTLKVSTFITEVNKNSIQFTKEAYKKAINDFNNFIQNVSGSMYGEFVTTDITSSSLRFTTVAMHNTNFSIEGLWLKDDGDDFRIYAEINPIGTLVDMIAKGLPLKFAIRALGNESEQKLRIITVDCMLDKMGGKN